MTTIKDLPEEILITIFKAAGGFACEQTQMVCKAWYIPAHALLLEDIRIDEIDKVDLFIKSIDSNPRPRFLNAVKKLEFSNPQWGSFDELDGEQIEKIFCRFPNLKSVCSFGGYALFENFNDDICKTLLSKCQKLERFNFSPGESGYGDAYYELVYRLKLLLTELNIDNLKDVSQYGGIVPYLTSFPRLRFLEGESVHLDSFNLILRILEKLPYLIRFTVLTANDEADMFAEVYLNSQSEQTRDIIIKRLAKVKSLTWICTRNLCINSAKFISKYCSNLNLLDLCSHGSGEWNDTQIEGFTSVILDLIVSQKDCSILLENMVASSFSVCLLAFLSKISDTENVLQLSLQPLFGPVNTFGLNLRCINGRFKPKIYVPLSQQLSLHDIASVVFAQVTPLNNLHEFVLEIKYRDLSMYPLETNVNMYRNILKIAPSVQKVTLDIPASFEDTQIAQNTNDRYSSVEELVLRGTAKTTIQSLFDLCSTVYPSLRRLEIYYHCGDWVPLSNAFHLILADYSLEHLIVDVTPIIDNLFNLSASSNFFVVHTHIGDEQHMYKVHNSFSSVSDVNDEDLNKVYFTVNIVMTSVQHLELYYNTSSKFYQKETYMHLWMSSNSSKHISIIKNE